MPEQTFSSIQPNGGIADHVPNPGAGQNAPRPPVKETTSLLPSASVAVMRVGASLALTVPALSGAIVAWWEVGMLNFGTLFLTILGVFASALSINVFWEYHDYRRSLAMDHNPLVTDLPSYSNYVLLRDGRVDPALALNFGLLFALIGLGCTLLLTMLTGWPILFFSGMAFILAYFYAAPPIRYGYWGWGLGELGVFVSFGLLAALGGYYVQAESLTLTSAWVSLSMGFFAILVVFNYNIIHYRRDWLIRKRTLVVMAGLNRGIDISVLITILPYAVILLAASLNHLPLWSLFALGGLPIALGGYSRIWRDGDTAEECVHLYETTITAVIVTGLLFGVSLWLDKIL